MSDQFVAEIRIFSCNFAPRGFASCNGQLLAISSNTALFSLVGTYYGGDGKSTFGLPNLQTSAPIHQGQGAGLSPYVIGQSGGSPNVTLLTANIPVHNHSFSADPAAKKESSSITGTTPAASTVGSLYSTANPNIFMNSQALSITGETQPHNNLQPYVVLNYCIALQGIYPERG